MSVSVFFPLCVFGPPKKPFWEVLGGVLWHLPGYLQHIWKWIILGKTKTHHNIIQCPIRTLFLGWRTSDVLYCSCNPSTNVMCFDYKEVWLCTLPPPKKNNSYRNLRKSPPRIHAQTHMMEKSKFRRKQRTECSTKIPSSEESDWGPPDASKGWIGFLHQCWIPKPEEFVGKIHHKGTSISIFATCFFFFFQSLSFHLFSLIPQ